MIRAQPDSDREASDAGRGAAGHAIHAVTTVVDGRFRIERAAARGGMGTVYFARDLHDDGAAIALKILDPGGEGSSGSGGSGGSGSDVFAAASTSAETVVLDESATREAELLSELRHPAIVRYVAAGALMDGRRYIAMEWVDGEDLGQHLNDRTFTVADTLRLGCRVAEALAAAHRIGVIHRDIKPANIILTDGCPELARLVDFGIAQVTRRSLHRGGTPGFAAPEQMVKGAEVDARADVFALGRVLIACLLHGASEDGDERTPATSVSSGDLDPARVAVDDAPLDLKTLCPGLPPALEALLLRMVAPQREARPAHGGVVAAALQDIVAAVGEADDAIVSAREHQLVATLGVPAGTLAGPHAAAVQSLGERHDATVGPGDATCELLHFHPHVADGDLMVRAVRCALELRRLLPGTAIALAIHQTRGDLETARSDTRGLLARMRAGGRVGVGLHEGAARLVSVRFEVEREAGVPLLIDERQTGGARLLLGRPSPWIGRGELIGALVGAAREARTRPLAVVVTGDAGMGKSRLAHELLDRLARSSGPPEVWAARGDPVTAGSPFALVAQLIKSAAAISDGQPPRTWQRRLRRTLAAHVGGPDLERLTIFIAELIGAPFPAERAEALRFARQDPSLMSRQTQRAWIDMVVAMSRSQPLVLWIDDLQWGDLASVRYLDDILDPSLGARVLLLAGARPEAFSRFPTLWSRRAVERVALPGLSEVECRAFVTAVLGDRALPIVELEPRTQGNPLFLEELVRSVDAGTFEDLPATIAAIIQSRLQGLEFAARQILRAASVFGQTFWLGAVAALLGTRGGGDLVRWLDALAVEDLVVARPSSRFPDTVEYDFRNVTVRDAAYAMLPADDARAAHLVAGAWLTRAGESDPVVLAEHFLRGGDHGEAAARFVVAADQAFLRHEFEAVLQLTARGLEHAPPGESRGRLLLRRAEVQGVAGNHHDAVESATAALAELPTNSPRWYSAVGEAAQASARLGDSARVTALIDRLSDIRATADGGGENFFGLVRAAVPLAAAGAAATAGQLLDNVILVTAKMADTDPGALGPMHAAKALRALARGAYGTIYLEMQAAADAFERVGSVRNSLEMAGGAGFAALELGALESGAEASLRRTIRRSREVGLEHLCAVARHNLGRRVGEAGRFDEGLELERAALASFAAHENRRMVGLTLAHIAWISLAADRLDEALRAADDAVARLHDQAASRLVALATRAQIFLRRGDIAAAVADATAAHTGLLALGRMQEGESLVRLTWTEVLAAAGRREEAEVALAAAVRSLEQRAALIEQDELRVSFCELPEHRRILQLARGAS